MLKLTPDHVGTRVLLSDGAVGLITEYFFYETDNTDAHVAVALNKGKEEFISVEGLQMHPQKSDPHVTLLLDMPNSFDVPVPEWCVWVYLYRPIFSSEPPTLVQRSLMDNLDHAPVVGWSPAPGQLPPIT